MNSSVEDQIDQIEQDTNKKLSLEEMKVASTKHEKKVAESKNNKITSSSKESRMLERTNEKADRKPRLTIEGLRNFRFNFLPDVINPDPDYHYIWLSRDQHAQPNYHDAVTRLGYSPCTTEELPEMAPYVQTRKLDNSITNSEIIVKEMVLCKIHNEDYQTLMRYSHHVLPAELESDVYRSFNQKLKSYGDRVAKLTEKPFDNDNENDDTTPIEQVFSSTRIGNDGVVSRVSNPVFK